MSHARVKRLPFCTALTLLALRLSPVHAETVGASPEGPPVDKSSYTLFNPTPRGHMREMNPDRPDATESPYTLDAGHLQFELSLVNYAYNHDNGIKTQSIDLLPSNIKIGLLNNVDLQFVFTPYERAKTAAAGLSQTTDGLPDSLIRLKINLWGNDGGATAFGLMPFIKLPTGTNGLSNHQVEGGLIVPFSIALPSDFSLGAMAEFDASSNDATGGYGVNFVHTLTLSHPLFIDKLEGYLEYIGSSPYKTGNTYQAIGSAGLVYGINDDWTVDVGGTIGLSGRAEDFTLFLGTTFRF